MPTNYSIPGVFSGESPTGVHPITGVNPSVTAFVGTAKEGPIDRPVRILSFNDYEHYFGGLSSNSAMSFAVRHFFQNGGCEAFIVRVVINPQPPKIFSSVVSEAEAIDKSAYAAYIGDRAAHKGIFALEDVAHISLLCLPAVSDPSILRAALSYCEERRLFMIVDAPNTVTDPDALGSLIQNGSLPRSDHAALYFPWIRFADSLNQDKPRAMPPCGAIAGLYARTDSERGVWSAPAGSRATITAAQGVDFALTHEETDRLSLLGINCIRHLPRYGVVAWGARTFAAPPSENKFISAQRLKLFLVESLLHGTKWVIFEPNDESLWAMIRLNIESFMHHLWRQGAFQGNTPAKAYFVKCDHETNTQQDISNGIVNILVGYAPLKPAEFFMLKIQQMAGHVAS